MPKDKTPKPETGRFVLVRDEPDGAQKFVCFDVDGPIVTVTMYQDSDLLSEREYLRTYARDLYRLALESGFRKSDVEWTRD